MKTHYIPGRPEPVQTLEGTYLICIENVMEGKSKHSKAEFCILDFRTKCGITSAIALCLSDRNGNSLTNTVLDKMQDSQDCCSQFDLIGKYFKATFALKGYYPFIKKIEPLFFNNQKTTKKQ